MKNKHNPKNRIGRQVFCYTSDWDSSFPVELISYDNNKIIKAKRVDTGEIIDHSRSWFFRALMNDPTVHRGIGPRELYVLGGGKRESFKMRQRRTVWRVGKRDFATKAEALRVARDIAKTGTDVVEVYADKHSRYMHSMCHMVIEVHPVGHAVQYHGDVRRTRGSHPKYIQGYGKLSVGLDRSASMRKNKMNMFWVN